MSNKKLFWIAFFILSCCEFAQAAKINYKILKPQENHLSSKLVINGERTSYSLPK